MKKKTLFFLLISMTSIFMFGCASSHINLVELGDVRVETVNSSNKYLSDIKVYQNKHLFEVFGKVSLRNKILAGTWHVDLYLTGPNGEVLTQTVIPYSISIKRKNKTWNFHTKIHLVPPKVSTLRIAVGECDGFVSFELLTNNFIYLRR